MRSKQFGEGAPARLVRWNFGVLQPVAAGVLVEVGAGINRFVDRIDVKPGTEGWRRIALCKARNGEHNKNYGQKTGKPHDIDLLSWQTLIVCCVGWTDKEGKRWVCGSGQWLVVSGQ